MGASAGLQQNVAEMVTVDNATPAEGQNSSEFGVTIALMDSAGPFDYHLSHMLINLCKEHAIPHQRVVAYFLVQRLLSKFNFFASEDKKPRQGLLSQVVGLSHSD